jgi:hypothetical protein
LLRAIILRRYSGNIQQTFREHSRNIQGTLESTLASASLFCSHPLSPSQPLDHSDNNDMMMMMGLLLLMMILIIG